MINLELLYSGFVNSYNSLLLPAGNEENTSQDTHAIIEWFRRTGISMGFYPYCEAKKRDLEWYTEDDKAVLHLESENFYMRVEKTINKLIESDANYRVGLMWTNRAFKDLKTIVQKAKKASKGKKWKMLLIIRSSQEDRDNEDQKDNTWRCPVRSWLISSGKVKKLDMFYIIWPKQWGYQTIEWAEN